MFDLENIQIFCDFDGTITKQDTLNAFLNYYTQDKWLTIEKDWIEGKIGSCECIKKQLSLVKSITFLEIDSFLKTLAIDESFFNFYNFIKENKIEFYIISDGFKYFINNILLNNNIQVDNIYSNDFTLQNGLFSLSFPNFNTSCKKQAGTCKCHVYQKLAKVNKLKIYIGDGLSDICVSDKVNFVFAKNKLLEHCKANRLSNYQAFRNFEEIRSFIIS